MLLADAPAWGVRRLPGGTLVRLPDVDGVPRALLALAPAEAPVADLPPDAWNVLDVRSGIPTIEAATVEQFVPQMLNYELIGGVDFQKGCYPGQEIVARSQYRGTIKRRMFLFECDALAMPGQEVFHSDDAGQPAGMVVNAAPLPNGGRLGRAGGSEAGGARCRQPAHGGRGRRHAARRPAAVRCAARRGADRLNALQRSRSHVRCVSCSSITACASTTPTPC